MKPISELVNDREACERIFSELTGGELVEVFTEPDHVELYGIMETYGPGSTYIYFDGVYETPVGRPKMIELILQELGYGPDPATTSSLPSEYTPPHTGS